MLALDTPTTTRAATATTPDPGPRTQDLGLPSPSPDLSALVTDCIRDALLKYRPASELARLKSLAFTALAEVLQDPNATIRDKRLTSAIVLRYAAAIKPKKRTPSVSERADNPTHTAQPQRARSASEGPATNPAQAAPKTQSTQTPTPPHPPAAPTPTSPTTTPPDPLLPPNQDPRTLLYQSLHLHGPPNSLSPTLPAPTSPNITDVPITPAALIQSAGQAHSLRNPAPDPPLSP